jgi:hypothetical protein
MYVYFKYLVYFYVLLLYLKEWQQNSLLAYLILLRYLTMSMLLFSSQSFLSVGTMQLVKFQ